MWVKWPGHKVYHSLTFSAEVKNEWSCTPHLICIFGKWWLITHMDKVFVCFLPGNFPASEFYMPTFRNTVSVPSGTDTVLWNVGIYNSDAGELPRRKHTTYRTWWKFEIMDKVTCCKLPYHTNIKYDSHFFIFISFVCFSRKLCSNSCVIGII